MEVVRKSIFYVSNYINNKSKQGIVSFLLIPMIVSDTESQLTRKFERCDKVSTFPARKG